TFHSIEDQSSYIDLLALGRPGDGGIVGRITGLPNDDDEAPLQRLAVDRGDQRVKEIILALSRRSGVRLERLHRHQQPAHWDGIAGRIDETKRVQTMERAVAKFG